MMEENVEGVLQKCKDCGYEVFVFEGVELFKFCPLCDSPNIKVI